MVSEAGSDSGGVSSRNGMMVAKVTQTVIILTLEGMKTKKVTRKHEGVGEGGQSY